MPLARLQERAARHRELSLRLAAQGTLGGGPESAELYAQLVELAPHAATAGRYEALRDALRANERSARDVELHALALEERGALEAERTALERSIWALSGARGALIVEVDDLAQVRAARQWFARWTPELVHVSRGGCGCCVDTFHVIGADEAISSIPPPLALGWERDDEEASGLAAKIEWPDGIHNPLR